MKPLYWTRIQMEASSTPLSGNVVVEIIWDKVEDIEVRCDELEEKFGKADLRVKSKQEPTAVKQTEKVAKIIDGKKSQNLWSYLTWTLFRILKKQGHLFKFCCFLRIHEL